jgi:hypothetical protein
MSGLVPNELPTPTATFFWGFGGGVAVEVALLYQSYLQPSAWPERYEKIGFWCVRLALAVIAGFLAVGYGVQSPILAANIGASAPLILKTLAEGLKPVSAITSAPTRQVDRVTRGPK